MNEPWICPRCKRVNAPFNPYCFCKPKDENSKKSEHVIDAICYLNPYNAILMPDVMKKTKINLPRHMKDCFNDKITGIK